MLQLQSLQLLLMLLPVTVGARVQGDDVPSVSICPPFDPMAINHFYTNITIHLDFDAPRYNARVGEYCTNNGHHETDEYPQQRSLASYIHQGLADPSLTSIPPPVYQLGPTTRVEVSALLNGEDQEPFSLIKVMEHCASLEVPPPDLHYLLLLGMP